MSRAETFPSLLSTIETVVNKHIDSSDSKSRKFEGPVHEVERNVVPKFWSKTRVGNLYAGLRLVIPAARKRLFWVLAIFAGMQRALPSMHTLPMPKRAATILAAYLSQNDYLFIGLLILLQQCRGLRPSELSSLSPNSFRLPGETS